MRDVVNHFVETAYVVGESVDDSMCDWPVPSGQVLTGEFLSHSKGRSELIKSDHLHSTPYSAWRIDGFPKPIKYHMLGTCWRKDGNNWHFDMPYVVGATGTAHCNNPILLTPYLKRLGSGQNTTFEVLDHYNTISSARNAFLAAIADQGAIDLGESLGEVKSTAGMMLARLAQLAKVFNAFKKGNTRLAAYHLGVKHFRPKDAANAYLEYKFGWLPLMNDIFNGYEAIKYALSKENGDLVSTTVERHGSPMVSVLALSHERSGSIDYFCKIGGTWRIKDSWKQALNSLGIANPLLILWQLRPLSFVVDWFISVGSFLQGISATAGCEFVAGYETIGVRSKILLKTYDQLGSFSGPVEHVMNSQGFTRRQLFTFPAPGISIRLTSDINKVLIVLALITQRS
jgi:hypothetical protein